MSEAIHEALRRRTGSARREVDTDNATLAANRVEPAPPTHRGHALKEAMDVINGERQDVYGSPEDSFSLISDYWTTYLRSRSPEIANAGFCLFADDVAMMMTLFKIAREANQHKRDNIVDAAGYLGIYADMQGAK